MTKSPRKNEPGMRIKPATVCFPGRTRIRPSERVRPQRHLKARNKWGLSPLKHLQIGIYNSGKFETLIALQNDLRWLLLHTWFPKFPRGRSPGPPYNKKYTGKFWISFFYPTSVLCPSPSPPPSHTDTKKTLFSRHLPMSRTTSPAPFFSYITSASDWIRLLLCKGKFPAFFLLELVNFID